MSKLNYEVIKIRSINHYLNILTKVYPNTNENNERFYRGLSNEKYADSDWPSIYRLKTEIIKNKRKKIEVKYEPYIKYEDKIFHDIIAKTPEDFVKCENTFECLVKMQHYGTPTRLLDVTTNPLIALYFSCVDNEENINYKQDGAIVIYDIPQSNIKNFNSDTITVLSNLARINENYTLFNSELNIFKKDINDFMQRNYNIADINNTYRLFERFKQIKFCFSHFANDAILDLDRKGNNTFSDIQFSLENASTAMSMYLNHCNKYNHFFSNTSTHNEDSANYLTNKINEKFNMFITSILLMKPAIDLKFRHLIQEEKPYFIHENIIPKHLYSTFCVKPKLNNPRILNQNGAFLIFGFANELSTKLTAPKNHFEFRAKNGDKHLKIVITKGIKNKIVNELKLLGIDRAFVYPEIESISTVIKNKYTIIKSQHSF